MCRIRCNYILWNVKLSFPCRLITYCRGHHALWAVTHSRCASPVDLFPSPLTKLPFVNFHYHLGESLLENMQRERAIFQRLWEDVEYCILRWFAVSLSIAHKFGGLAMKLWFNNLKNSKKSASSGFSQKESSPIVSLSYILVSASRWIFFDWSCDSSWRFNFPS